MRVTKANETKPRLCVKPRQTNAVKMPDDPSYADFYSVD